MYVPICENFPDLLPQLRTLLMSAPSSPALQQLNRFERSSPGFQDQLSNVLYGQEYTQCVPIIEDDDLAWLVDFLSKVCRHVAPPTLHPLERV